ncbi:hypothetical protein B0T11DRAFT_232861 [Plectosphaerella cucumerina]|uniref:DUF1479-domain-containing protein n=1 Tax=Plectosphaerella cucumerina TaxID=40658 RepID=A0A8K0T8Z5_9PEZI|nr:hypothetical protein B0T11DRAFT_232861 [Plectosphaerella cucumerina]
MGQAARKEGDISAVFRSLSGGEDVPLPPRFADVKRSLLERSAGRDALQESWNRLLERLSHETEHIKANRATIIPEINFADIGAPSEAFNEAFRKRGVAVVRQVVPEKEARDYKTELEEYIAANPSTKSFPADKPAVFELYWSRPQLAGRTHPNMLKAQAFLMSYYHSKDPNAEVSTTQPLIYADRLRIRQPGDAGFALGPHVDGGSVERWEDEGYGRGGVYDEVLRGRWESFDPWETSARLDAVSDLYHGAGSCSMFRMFQGWLGLSHTAPGEGTLLVNPLFNLATAYYLLRPFFAPRGGDPLSPSGWKLEEATSTALQGAEPGLCQELSEAWHPHLDLANTMVHVPQIAPGDYVAWHCDTIHSVDRVHAGKGDSSVMYIPSCPVTKASVDYVRQQRAHFEQGIPPVDFPGGVGESAHVGRPGVEELKAVAGVEGLRGLGYAPFDVSAAKSEGERAVLEYGNSVLR